MTDSTKTDPWIGQVLGTPDRYRLDRCLGGGGMGDVYLAMDLNLGRQMALKLLKAGEDEQTDLHLRKRFEREVTISAALSSEHIVQVTDHGVTPDGHPFYVMEYLNGSSLGQEIRKYHRLSLKRTINIVLQVCEGLKVAHEGITLYKEGATTTEFIKVVHRDLKPDNIFLLPHARFGELVKILDFGIAKIWGEGTLTREGSFLGTCRYAAPEQWRGDEDIDGRADIYSLGLIIYEMLSGTDPFGLKSDTRGIHPTSWMAAHAFTEARPIRQLPGCSEIPIELEGALIRCLAKEPADRFQTIEALSWAIQKAVGILQPEPRSADTTHTDRIWPTTPAPQLDLPIDEASATLELPPTQPDTPFRADATVPQVNTATTPLPTPPQIRQSPTTGQPNDTIHRSPTAALPTQPDTSLPTSPKPKATSSKLLWWGGISLGALIACGILVAIVRPFGPGEYDELLTDARSAVEQGDYTAGIELAKQIPSDHKDYSIAQDLIPAWQLDKARSLATGGNYLGAIEEAKKITADQSSYASAQTSIGNWAYEQGLIWIEDANLDRALNVLNDIPEAHANFARSQQTSSDINQVTEARALFGRGELKDAIAAAYAVDPGQVMATQAESIVCDSLAEIVDLEYKTYVDASFNDPDQSPILQDYQFDGCLSASLEVGINMVKLNDEEENLKINSVILAGYIWDSLPDQAHSRLANGSINFDYLKNDQTVATVIFTKPVTMDIMDADLASAQQDPGLTETQRQQIAEEALNKVLSSIRVQRPST